MAGLGVGAVLFVWAVGALLGGGDTPQVRGAADIGPGGAPARTSAPVSDPPSSGPLPGSPSGSASATASPVSSVAPTASSVPRPTTTSPAPPTTTTPSAPAACPDSVVRVTVSTGQPSYPVGSQPLLTLHVTNAGHVPCVRDVSHQLRSIEVLRAGGTKPVWASDDCYSPHTDEVHTLAAGETLSYSVRWSGRTAKPGCPAERAAVPAGSYQVVGRLGGLASPPVPLLLTD